jgi:hypothetical protein
MWLVGILQFRRTFFFFKIFDDYTPIVIMLTDVMGTLVYFGIFFLVDLVLFALTLAILGLNNYKVPGKFRDTFFVVPEEQYCDASFTVQMRQIPGAEISLDGEAPGYEYYSIGYGIGYVITVLRMSLGDIDLGSLEYHTLTEQILLYIVILFIIIVNSIIFLNFIVAHACNTYTIISD